MFDVEETFGRLNLYLDHLDINLSEYLSQAITYDMDDLVSKKIGPSKKRYYNDFSVDEMIDWAGMEVETDGVRARTSTTEGVEARNSTTEGVEARNNTIAGVEARIRTKDKGKEKVSEDASDVVKTRRCTVEVGTETEYKSDDDSDYQSDKSVDYLIPGEDELIKLRNKMKANKKEKAKAKYKPDSRMNELNEENSMLADNVRGETFKEHDIYMNKLLKSLKIADKDGITEDPFISVEKHVERRGEERVVAKYGQRQRPPRVSAPEKEYEKSVGKHYSMLRSYRKAILDSNPGSTIKLGVTVNLDGKTYFGRFYVCFAGLADGWKSCCRKIIALDGCFLKKPNQGEILTAIELLKEDLGCSRGNGLTIMSDQHKVLACNTFWLPESYVPAWFETDMYFVTYHNYVKLVPGMNFWPNQSMYSTVLLPNPRKMPGRPKKKSIRVVGKGSSSTRVSKVGSQESCSNCKQHGHNESSCKEPIVEQTPKPKGVVGAAGSRDGASGSICRGVGRSSNASGSRGRGTVGSRGGASGFRDRDAGGSKMKPVSTMGTQKRQGKKKAHTSAIILHLKFDGARDWKMEHVTEEHSKSGSCDVNWWSSKLLHPVVPLLVLNTGDSSRPILHGLGQKCYNNDTIDN
nr:multidrug resistance-associated protein 5 [Tanacetum cinerariifolium]